MPQPSKSGLKPSRPQKPARRVRAKPLGQGRTVALQTSAVEQLVGMPPPPGVHVTFVADDAARKGSQASSAFPAIESAAYRPNARARALLRGAQIAQDDLKAAGGAYDPEAVQTLLNGVTRQAVEKRVKDGSLLAVPGPSNRRRYPTLQFTRDGVVPGLKAVQEALPTRNAWAVLNFFVHPDHLLGGRKPIDVLREGDVELVISAARGMGRQGG